MIKTIIQIADVHIHNLQRHEEYAIEIDKLVGMCTEIVSHYNKDEVRILICGDLVHQKNDISNELIIFTSEIIRQLSKICKVYVYSGNHDLLIKNKTRIDTLTGIFETAKFDNAYYLDLLTNYQSNCVVDENVIFALYSIHDNFSRPDIETAKAQYPTNKVIGLYHGVITGAQLFNGLIAENGLNGDTFEGCDVVMAGDNHKRQVIQRGDVTIVYPGSLIQQDYGETITQHGFAVWNIEDMTYKFVELPSEYGYYNFEISSIDDVDNNNEKLINY